MVRVLLDLVLHMDGMLVVVQAALVVLIIPIDMVAVPIHLVLILGLVPLLVAVMVVTMEILEQQLAEPVQLVAEEVVDTTAPQQLKVVLVDLALLWLDIQQELKSPQNVVEVWFRSIPLDQWPIKQPTYSEVLDSL